MRLFRPNGPVHIEYYPKTASTAFAFNDLVALDTTGTLIVYVAGGAYPMVGLIQEAVAATDATTKKVPVLVAPVDAEYLIDATTTGAATTDIGEYCDYVAATQSVNVGSSSNDEFYITQIISTTLVVGKFTQRLPVVL